MTYSVIQYDVSDAIATITLSRPEKLNAISNQVIHEVTNALDRVDADDEVRAVIITGAGRAFSAGADLSRGADTFDQRHLQEVIRDDGSFDYSHEAARDGGGRIALRLFRMLKPVIGAINGPAVGLGATVTLPMDIRLASETAKFGFVFSRRGMVPEAASSYFLPRIVGISRALEWCYSGQLIDADEALQGGLVKAVLPPDELMPVARRIARGLVEQAAPVSVALIRQMMWRGLGMSDPMEAHRVDSRGILARGRSTDSVEGVRSFMEKRPPAFKDRVSADMPDYFPWWNEQEFH